MHPQHKEIFFAVASQLNCWIGLREPNELSDQWVGKEGYIPKPVSCKAKTADAAGHPFAGLVVSPVICEEAFKLQSQITAIEKWKEFAPANQLPAGYTCEKEGREKGLVKLHGCAIHADYDLMVVCRTGSDGEIGFTTLEEQKMLFTKAASMLNQRLGSPMIQHGAEFMWDGGVGARESEQVYFFGTGRRFRLGHSSMPKKAMAH